MRAQFVYLCNSRKREDTILSGKSYAKMYSHFEFLKSSKELWYSDFLIDGENQYHHWSCVELQVILGLELCLFKPLVTDTVPSGLQSPVHNTYDSYCFWLEIRYDVREIHHKTHLYIFTHWRYLHNIKMKKVLKNKLKKLKRINCVRLIFPILKYQLSS